MMKELTALRAAAQKEGFDVEVKFVPSMEAAMTSMVQTVPPIVVEQVKETEMSTEAPKAEVANTPTPEVSVEETLQEVETTIEEVVQEVKQPTTTPSGKPAPYPAEAEEMSVPVETTTPATAPTVEVEEIDTDSFFG